MLFKSLQGLLELITRHPRAGADLGVGVAEAGGKRVGTGHWHHGQAFPFDRRYRANQGSAPGTETGQDLGLGQWWINRVGVEDG
jgi:hypothetical protein